MYRLYSWDRATRFKDDHKGSSVQWQRMEIENATYIRWTHQRFRWTYRTLRRAGLTATAARMAIWDVAFATLLATPAGAEGWQYDHTSPHEVNA